MLLSQMLAAALSLSANGVAMDPVDDGRNAFNACLQRYVTAQIAAHKSVSEIRSGVAGQCTAEEATYRAAMIRSDVAARISQADAERSATDEINYSRENARQSVDEPQPR